MDGKLRRKMHIHQQAIIRDLHVNHIIEELVSKNAITFEDFERIAKVNDRADQVKCLIDILNSNTAYEVFVDSLRKDYNWLWEKLVNGGDCTVVEDSYEDGLSKGDVPRLPEHYVRRVALEKNIAENLRNLTRHNILALHGMPGSGKSVAATGALRNNPDVVTENFHGVVFWLNMYGCMTEDDVLLNLNKLYRKVTTMYPNNSYRNSSISMSSSSISFTESLSNLEGTLQDLKDILKVRFEEYPLKESLLVLDKVSDIKVLEGFDIGCKILVTTKDMGVVIKFHPQIMKVEDYFTEQESLQLFANCIDVEVKALPRQAKKLHELCKGSPFHVSLIGADLAENKERLLHDNKQWNYFINKYKKSENFFGLSYHDNNPVKTIEVCINSLKSDIIPLFKMLVILPVNAKVSVIVLSKLWNKETVQVERIMKQLRSKSLVIETYDQERHTYTYEIHQLIMNYLQVTSNTEDTKKFHMQLLKNYEYLDVDHYPVDIQDDGYIAYYIGYHLYNSENLNNSYKLFNKLFLDLKFIGNKVRLAGPADVIFDLKKYEDLIADNDTLARDLISSIKAYLSTYGHDLYRYPNTNIIQSILQNESRGPLYTKAYDVAQCGCAKNELYFEFLHEQNEEEIKYSTIDVQDVITSVCFLGDYVLVGTRNGVIKFFHISTNKLKKILPSTNISIKWIGACPVNLLIVAALNIDGVINLWYVDDLDQDDINEMEEEKESLNNNYPNVKTIQPKLGPYLNCRWTNNEEILIAHTKDIIVLYKTSGEVLQLLDNLHRDRHIVCCVPCNYDKNVIVATRSTLEVINTKTKSIRQTCEETNIVMDVLAVPGTNQILTLKPTEITEHTCDTRSIYRSVSQQCRCKTIIKSDVVKENALFISMAVNKTGSILFVSTNDSRILCVNLKTCSYMFDLENRRGNVITMAVSEVLWDDFEPGVDVLLTGTGSEENSVKIWYLEAAYIAQNTYRNGKVRLKTKFDASFIPSVSPIAVHSASSSGPISTTSTPQRHQSFVNQRDEVVKKVVKSTRSLDRHSLKPLNLKGICNGNIDSTQPLLAVVDDRNNIQILKGRKLVSEVHTNPDEIITTITISPCNQHIVYGLSSGIIRKYAICSKETQDIMDVNSEVVFMSYVNPKLLIVAGKNRCLMAYRWIENVVWKPQMMQRGTSHLGSQELLNEIQGLKKKSNQSEDGSNSGSESISSKDRLFPSHENKELCKWSSLVNCYILKDAGLITVENNATVKLWDQNLQVSCVLHGRQTDVNISCSALQKNMLVLCDHRNHSFQIFTIKKDDKIELQTLGEFNLLHGITSCTLTADGNILAMGLDSGEVVLWNVPNKRQIMLLKHHKSKVHWCSFSPVPERLSSSSAADQPPLVLVTLATEIVWWDITYLLNTRPTKRIGWNVVTPIASPLDIRNGTPTNDQVNEVPFNFFFGDYASSHHCWKANWKHKTYKEGSKRKEILACIKLSGMNAKRICFDEKFSCFVTIDDTGHIHIMNIMHAQNT